jgi:hypothetical protein
MLRGRPTEGRQFGIEGCGESLEMSYRTRLTVRERIRYRTWWIEESGLSREELVSIAIGLGGQIITAEWLPKSEDRPNAAYATANARLSASLHGTAPAS